MSEDGGAGPDASASPEIEKPTEEMKEVVAPKEEETAPEDVTIDVKEEGGA